VRGNFNRLGQVLVNLIINACQSLTRRDAGIKICTYLDELSGRAVVEVTDEGEGIDEAVLPRVREPFFTTKEGKGGTGLGLSISQKIVNDHKGELLFESALGRGTTVRLFLPCCLGVSVESPEL